MMGLFSKQKSFVGFDLGTGSIKLVEVKSEDKIPKLATYGWIDQSSDLIKSDAAANTKLLADSLKQLWTTAHCSSRKCISALPSFSVFSYLISLPPMPDKDIDAAVKWEAKKVVPMPIEEVTLDWKIVDKGTAPGTGDKSGVVQNIKVLLTVAPRAIVQRYLSIFTQAGLELVSLETESFALARSLIGYEPTVAMLIDLGMNITDIVVVDNGIPTVNRSVDVGGSTITKAISNAMNIDMKRAEQFKRDVGFAQNIQAGGVMKVIQQTFAPIVNEIQYSRQTYQEQRQRQIEKVVLSGGTAWLPGLTTYLESVLQLKVLIGDPWSHISYPQELAPALRDIGPSMAVSIGLALREFV